jgi:hypothetical protein
VVVGILALLVSVLVPSLRSSRQSAQTVKCASNLRQLGTGWTVYSQNFDGAIVPGRVAKIPGASNVYWVGNGEHFRPRWYVQLGAEAGFNAFNKPSPDPADDNIKTVDNEVCLCPARPQWINNRNFGYGYNFQFLGNSRFRPTSCSATPTSTSRLRRSSATAALRARPIPCRAIRATTRSLTTAFSPEPGPTPTRRRSAGEPREARAIAGPGPALACAIEYRA